MNGSSYTYSWTGATTSSNEDLLGIGAGTYNLIATDDNGCTTSESVVIIESNEVTLSYIQSNYNGFGVSCSGNNDGWIDLTVNGGTSPYTYLWDTADTTEDISNILAGSYNVTIIDENGCDTNATFTITEPNPINWSAISSNLLCFNDNTGSINLTVTGGTPGYTFSWTGPNGYTELT